MEEDYKTLILSYMTFFASIHWDFFRALSLGTDYREITG